MIQSKIIISVKGGTNKLVCGDAYALYGALMERINSGLAENLHSNEYPLITQSLVPIRDGMAAVWTVNVLDDKLYLELSPVLEKGAALFLNSKNLKLDIEDVKRIKADKLDELLAALGSDKECTRFHMKFVSPSAFKSAGEYVFLPSTRHILTSLLLKWNASFPFSPADDEDAMAALIQGVRITGYNLKSVYYQLKGNSIPAFVGSITLNARLSAPLLGLLRGLLAFGNFSGVGIKTALGMGGVEIKESPKPVL